MVQDIVYSVRMPTNSRESRGFMGKRIKEGRRIKTLCPMNYVGPFIMRTRQDATNYYADRFDVKKAEEFIRSKKQQGMADYNMMYLLLAAYVRTVAKHPELNRFIRGQRIYARNNIEIVMTIKILMDVNAPETVVKVIFPPEATADDVYRILHEKVEEARNGDTEFDNIANFFKHVPRILMRGAMDLFYFLDYFGWMPKKLTDVSPFHGSFAITSMGSLRIQPIFHHLYNFGNIPVFCSFGNGYITHTTDEDGNLVRKKYIDLRFSLDERITDGLGYATVFHYLKYLLSNPTLLDVPPEEVIQDID